MREYSISPELPGLLLPWYAQNRRQLPWREDRQPYHIWLSEIMLQQTRVEAVRGYYLRFLNRLPTIEALANCDDDTLTKLWEGLGYYSRVRNLKKAAIQIMDTYGGLFPSEYDQILALPGIGEYTAGAICSIAFNQPTPAVDGNVLRVVSRLLDDPSPIDLPQTKAWVRQQLAHIYPEDAGSFTQALMELGATVCGPNRQPTCEICPCRDICLAFRNATASQLPVKSPKKPRHQEDRTVFVVSSNGRYALQKRPDSGLLAGLWQFPNISGRLEPAQALQWLEQAGIRPRDILKSLSRTHIFTHIQWNMTAFYIEAAEPAGDFSWLTAEEINTRSALPTAFRQFWEETDNV